MKKSSFLYPVLILKCCISAECGKRTTQQAKINDLDKTGPVANAFESCVMLCMYDFGRIHLKQKLICQYFDK